MPSDEDAAVLQLRAEMEALRLKLAAAEANAAAARESRHDTSQGAYLDDAACARSEAEHIFHAMNLDPSARVDYWRGVQAAGRDGRAKANWCDGWLAAASEERAAEIVGAHAAAALAARARGDAATAVDHRRAFQRAVDGADGALPATRERWAAFAKEELAVALWEAGATDDALALAAGYEKYALLSQLVAADASLHDARVASLREARRSPEEPALPFARAPRDEIPDWRSPRHFARVLAEAAVALHDATKVDEAVATLTLGGGGDAAIAALRRVREDVAAGAPDIDLAEVVAALATPAARAGLAPPIVDDDDEDAPPPGRPPPPPPPP